METLDTSAWLKAQRPQVAGPLRAAAIAGATAGSLAVVQAWGLAWVVDGAVFGGQGLTQLMPWLWVLLPVFALRAALQWRADRWAFQAAQQIKRSVRSRLLEQFRVLGPAGLAEERSGELASVLVDSVEGLEPYFARYLPAVALVGVIPLVLLVAVLPADWLSALVLLVTAPLIPLFMILIGNGAERLNRRQWRVLTRLGGRFLDVLQGLTTLKIFNASRREAEAIARSSDAFRRNTMAVLRLAFLSSAVLEFFTAISIAVIAVFIGFRLLNGEMDFFHGFFVLLLAPEFYLPLRNLGAQHHARMETVGAAEDIVRLLQRKPYIPPAVMERTPIPTLADIHFKGVGFRYPDGRLGLEGLNITLPAGRHTVLVGPSGAGKSTLVALLLRFIPPTQGQILLGSTPLENIGYADWQRKVAWISQRPRLFSTSVRENIRLGEPGADDRAIQTAAEKALAWDFIKELPDGLDTRLGDGGHPLSGGRDSVSPSLGQCCATAPSWYWTNLPLIWTQKPRNRFDRH